MSATEAGCFAKTYALNPKDEPIIHGAVMRPGAYLENVSMSDDGEVDFYDQNYTKNGRAVFSFADIEAADAADLVRAHFLLVLNRNENVIPAVAKPRGAAGGGVLHARRDDRHLGRRQGRGGQVPARARARTRSSP